MQTALLRFGVKIMVTPYCLSEDTLSTVSQPKKVYTHDCGRSDFEDDSVCWKSIQGQKKTARDGRFLRNLSLSSP